MRPSKKKSVLNWTGRREYKIEEGTLDSTPPSC